MPKCSLSNKLSIQQGMWKSHGLPTKLEAQVHYLDLYHSPTLIHFVTMVLWNASYSYLDICYRTLPEQPIAGSAPAI